MQYVFRILMFVVGAIMGSFLCCEVRRLHEREQKHQKFGRRSVCLNCKYQLKWYDNIPILSWLFLRGRCRKCGKKIGSAEIFSELLCAIALTIMSLNFNPEEATAFAWTIFVCKILLTLALFFIAIYDGLYKEFPTFAVVISAILAVLLCIFTAVDKNFVQGFMLASLTDPLLSMLFFGGIYLVLYLASKGRLVGDGDWLLAGIIGLALGSVWQSLIALFLANLSASLIMLPMLSKTKNHKIPFGPFLVLGYVLVISGCVIISI